jgi:hypothetical protein
VPGAGQAAAPAVAKRLGAIKEQIRLLARPEAHNCGNACDDTCTAGAGAYWDPDKGSGERAVITFCAGFEGRDVPMRAAILIHEAGHALAEQRTEDYAGASERSIDFLTTAQALRNSDSYVNFVFRIDTKSTPEGPSPLEKPKADVLTGEDASPDEQVAMKRTLARVEKLVMFAGTDVSSLYTDLKEARQQGSWTHPAVRGFARLLMDLVAPRFALTPTRVPPTVRDQTAVAAIADRYNRMRFSLFGQPHTLTKNSAGTTDWEDGPGTHVTVDAVFFAVDSNRRTDLLLVELVRATPGINSDLVPEYVALAHDIETTFHR